MCSSLSLIDPLHHEKCITSLPNRGVCLELIDFTIWNSAHLELALSKPETWVTNLRHTARLMICDNHKNWLQEAHCIACEWEEQAAQKPHAIIHSLASTDMPTYKQFPIMHQSIGI